MEIRASLLARNTLLNFIGQAVPLIVGVVTIPFIVRGLGTDRFGLLSLPWVILGYFAIFDLALGRATTKFVAEVLGEGVREAYQGLLKKDEGKPGVLVDVRGMLSEAIKVNPGVFYWRL